MYAVGYKVYHLLPFLIIIRVMTEAIRVSETSVYSNETTRRYNPEGSHRDSDTFYLLNSLLLRNIVFSN
jgi:hypothetical protein